MMKDEAVVLRLMDWSETSQIAVLLTERHGKVSAVAKGAKRQQPSTLARFSGGLELLTAGEALWITKRSSEMVTLTEWDLGDGHWHLRRDLRAHRLGLYAADVIHHLVTDHDPHPVAYGALRVFLAGLGEVERGDEGERERQAGLLRFHWDVVKDMGYEPIVDRDAETGEALPVGAGAVGFSAAAGGVVGEGGGVGRWRVRRGTVGLLGRVAGGDGLGGEAVEDLERANRLMCVYVRALLDKELPTMGVLLGGDRAVR